MMSPYRQRLLADQLRQMEALEKALGSDGKELLRSARHAHRHGDAATASVRIHCVEDVLAWRRTHL